ncbi:Uncharacterised protein [Plesiomonas shigelloides]|nr:Uncharacterised protein [Plesiomonas shigelloides]
MFHLVEQQLLDIPLIAKHKSQQQHLHTLLAQSVFPSPHLQATPHRLTVSPISKPLWLDLLLKLSPPIAATMPLP